MSQRQLITNQNSMLEKQWPKDSPVTGRHSDDSVVKSREAKKLGLECERLLGVRQLTMAEYDFNHTK